MSEEGVVNAVHHFRVEFDGSSGLMFSQATTPQATLEVPDFKTFSGDGKTVLNSVGGGTQVTWSPITLTRGVDSNHDLYDWFKEILETGVAENKKVLTLVAVDSAGEDMHTWTCEGAIITQYGHSGANAQTMEVLVNTVQIKYETAKLDF